MKRPMNWFKALRKIGAEWTDEQQFRKDVLFDTDFSVPRTFEEWRDLGFSPMLGEHGTRHSWGRITFTFEQCRAIIETRQEGP